MPTYNFTGEIYYAASHSLDENNDDGDGDTQHHCLITSNNPNDDNSDDHDASIDDDQYECCLFLSQVIVEYLSIFPIFISIQFQSRNFTS